MHTNLNVLAVLNNTNGLSNNHTTYQLHNPAAVNNTTSSGNTNTNNHHHHNNIHQNNANNNNNSMSQQNDKQQRNQNNTVFCLVLSYFFCISISFNEKNIFRMFFSVYSYWTTQITTIQTTVATTNRLCYSTTTVWRRLLTFCRILLWVVFFDKTSVVNLAILKYEKWATFCLYNTLGSFIATWTLTLKIFIKSVNQIEFLCPMYHFKDKPKWNSASKKIFYLF